MTDVELRERCAYWQKVLRLQDWKIDVRYAGTNELGGSMGRCEVWANSKVAVVWIASDESVDLTAPVAAAFPGHYKPEFTLIHELLHIPFHELMTEEPTKHEQTLQEQALDLVADALFSLSRGE